MQLSQARLKQLAALQQKKFRREAGLFVAEGQKVVGDLVQAGWMPEYVVTAPDQQEWARSLAGDTAELLTADERQFKKLSSLSTPPGMLAVFPIPQLMLEDAGLDGSVTLLLDGVADPGNMGTIIRTAHWFGVKEILLAGDCTDPFAPKVVQATMGSLAAVKLFTVKEPEILLKRLDGLKRPLLVADLGGISLTSLRPADYTPCVLVMGSESHGPGAVWREAASGCVHIAAGSEDHPDSLNVAVSTGILLHHFSIAG